MPSPSNPIAFSIGSLSIRWYALFILCGIIAAISLIYWLVQKRRMDPDFLLDVAPWVVFGAIIGARGYYILLKFSFYIHHPEEAINVRTGGLTIHGALVAGAAVIAYFCWRRHQRFFAWTDVIIPGVALGQAIGRWGNWANQEAFGTPTSLPWGLKIDPAHRPPQYLQYTHFHPTFLYEMILDLINCVVLAWLALRLPKSKTLREGDILGIYCIAYGIGRFAIESIRTDSLYIGPLPAAYWLSFALIAIGTGLLIARRTIWPPAPLPVAATDPAAIDGPAPSSPRIDEAPGETSRA